MINSVIQYYSKIVNPRQNLYLVLVTNQRETVESENSPTTKDIIEEKDKHRALMFINSLECVLHKQGGVSDYADVLERILQYRKYLQGNAPSLKMVLEHLALIIPTM